MSRRGVHSLGVLLALASGVLVQPASPWAQETKPAETAVLAAVPLPPSKPKSIKQAAFSKLWVTIDPGVKAGVAAYRRGDYLYVVFDQVLDRDFAAFAKKIKSSGVKLEEVAAVGATSFRFHFPPSAVPVVQLQETVWQIGAAEQAGTQDKSLKVELQPDFALGPRILVHAEQAGRAARVTDTDAGDVLTVIPLPEPGMGVARPLRYPQADLLGSAQGIVVRPVSDTVVVRPVRDGVEISDTTGLILSSAQDLKTVTVLTVADAPSSPASDNKASETPVRTDAAPLFDLTAWRMDAAGGYTEVRQKLQHALMVAPEGAKSESRLALAHFYFARGLGQEALGFLELMVDQRPDMEQEPQFLALRGAVRVLGGQSDGLKDIEASGLNANPEMLLWRAVAKAEGGDWVGAAPDFKAGLPVLETYPEPFYSRFMQLAAETALSSGDAVSAQTRLKRMEERSPQAKSFAAVKFLKGILAHQDMDDGKARQYWQEAARSTDQLYRTLAEQKLVDLDLSEVKIKPEQATERLERLRFAWRGDERELQLLKRLGQLYLDTGRYAEGLTMLRQAAGYFPDAPGAKEIIAEMGKIFADLFVGERSKGLQPMAAVALYEQFKELTPAGAEGDAVIRALAEKLVAVDLLGRAGDLLAGQVEFRLKDMEKAQVGARLAAIRLLDDKPEAALKALDMSAQPELEEKLEEERRLLRARALADLKRPTEALQVLANDNGRLADMLRVDIAWRARQWTEAATALDKLIGAPPKPEDGALKSDVSRLVMNRAVALALAGDTEGVQKLRDDFGATMSQGADANAFHVLTRAGQSSGLVDAATIQSRVAEVDTFKDFLNGYRDRGSAVQQAAIQ